MNTFSAFAVGVGSLFLGSMVTHAQGTIVANGYTVLAPAIAPVGGMAANPQEYLSVAWTVWEVSPSLYTYGFKVQNPTGDVVVNSAGALTSVPQLLNSFTLDFNTAGGVVAGSQTGGTGQSSTTSTLVWDFSPSLTPGTSTLLTFQSAVGPTASGSGTVDSSSPAAPWTSGSGNGGGNLPVPNVVPEPKTESMLTIAAFLVLPARGLLVRKIRPKSGIRDIRDDSTAS